MSGECEECGEHTLECRCKSQGSYTLTHICSSSCPYCHGENNHHLNLLRNYPEFDDVNPRAHLPEVKWINIRGRVEHEAIIRDEEWCKDLGLDQSYEITVYLKRWGSWLN